MDSKSIKSLHLVEEIMEQILSRLPVKSLMRFRCVSKSWLSLISSQRFIETHLRKSRKSRALSHNHRVIFQCDDHQVLNECSLLQLLNEPSSTIKPSPICDPENNQLMEVIGCCNGLICFFKEHNFHLWNPATRISIELPDLDNVCVGSDKYGFGWDETNDAYKVFVLTTLGGISKADVYNSKTNSWKTVVEHGRPYVDVMDIPGVFACGKIHWIIQTMGEEYVESWDLESEEFGMIELPAKPPQHYNDGIYVLADIEGCLHLLCVHECQSYAVFWVMKEDSVWLKLFTLRLFFKPNPDLLCRPLFGGGPNGEIVVILIDSYLVYSPNDDMHVVRAGKNKFNFYNGVVCVESLVSPNQILQQVAS